MLWVLALEVMRLEYWILPTKQQENKHKTHLAARAAFSLGSEVHGSSKWEKVVLCQPTLLLPMHKYQMLVVGQLLEMM